MNPYKLKLATILLFALIASASSQTQQPRRNHQPNFIVILADDMGYGDIGPFGGSIPTPAFDRMARQGLVATDYYAPQNICTPSRAGLLTGRYPVRTGLGYEVILNGDNRVLPTSEKTIPDALKSAYTSGLFGKWHLGQTGPDWLPTHHGFDTFYGIPYSHDIQPLSVYQADAKTGSVTSTPPVYTALQEQFYSHAEQFIEQNRNHPFFVELALSAPHLPEYPTGRFKGQSKDAGPYGDVIMQIDSIVGRLLDKLKELHLDQDTIVIFTSDNGPWFEGSTGPLRDRKGGAGYDGGYRVPFIAWAPGRIKPGKTNAVIDGIDLLPTFCSMASLPPPQGVTLDGRDITGVLTRNAPSPHDEILLFNNEDIVGIRTQQWKYVDQTYYRGSLVNFGNRQYKQLYNEAHDSHESYSLADTHPDTLADMQRRLQQARDTYAPFQKRRSTLLSEDEATATEAGLIQALPIPLVRISPMSSPQKSEKEKMIAGELYNAEDPILVADRLHSAALLHKYNSDLFNPVTHIVQLKELLGSAGDHSVIRPPFFVDYGYNIHLGDSVFLNFNCVLLDVTTITIGDRTQIGPAVQIYAADHPRDPALRRANLENGRPVHIGANVWIGGGAVILPGVTIGDDAIIGAGSIVTRDVPAGVTVIGNPARTRR